MRVCQNCAAPIATSAKTCEHCGAEQRLTVGGESPSHFAEVQNVAEENTVHDQKIARFTLMMLVGSAALISLVTGFSLGSVVVAGSTFFVALLALFVLFQVAGIDVSM